MYLPQAVSLQPLLGVEWDLFHHDHLTDDVQFEPAAVSSSVAMPLFPTTPLQTRQVHRGKTGPFLRRIVHDHLHLPSEMGLGGRNRANQAIRPSPLYLYSYSFFSVYNSTLYIFMYVPATA
jgi:hypothetical protein